jgi:hypothetical protein
MGAQVDPFRFTRESTHERRRQRPRLTRREIAGWIVPGELAISQRNQQRARTLVRAPIGDLLADPLRHRSLGRSQQDQVARLRERLLDRGPQARRRREARVVAEDAQRAAPIPRLAEHLHHRLQGRGDSLVLGVTVRDEGIVDRHRAPLPRVPQ